MIAFYAMRFMRIHQTNVVHKRRNLVLSTIDFMRFTRKNDITRYVNIVGDTWIRHDGRNFVQLCLIVMDICARYAVRLSSWNATIIHTIAPAQRTWRIW